MTVVSTSGECSTNIAARLVDHAQARPHQRAVVFPQGRDSDGNVRWTHLTFAQLNGLADEYAHGLTELGVQRGDRVSLLVKPCLQFIPLVFSIFKIGALPVLIDPGMGRRGFLSCIARVSPRVLIGEPLAQVLRRVFRRPFRSVEVSVTNGSHTGFWGGTTLEGCRLLGTAKGPFVAADVSPEDEAAILFTSGSTGPAKGVTYTHRIFDTQTRLIQSMYGIEPGEIDLACFPLFGLFSVAMGMTVVIPDMDPTKPALADPEKLIEAIEAHGCTSAFGSPAIWKNMAIFAGQRQIRLPSMRRILMAGAPIPVWMHQAFQKIFDGRAELHTPYGATESLPVATIGSWEVLSDTAEKTRQGAGTCVGRPVPGSLVRMIEVSDEPIQTWSDDLIVAQGMVGEITVRGDMVTTEYKDEPEHTALAKIDEDGVVVHRMGDLGYFDAEGRIWFCGRKSHRVRLNDGGLKFTVPCEGVFNHHPDVYRTALVGVDGQPVLVVELEPGVTKRDQIVVELRKLGAANDMTRDIQQVLFHPGFPVDVRHNAKIHRLALSDWARGQL